MAQEKTGDRLEARDVLNVLKCYRRLTFEKLASHFHLQNAEEKKHLGDILETLESKGLVTCRKDKWRVVISTIEVEGTYHIGRLGEGAVMLAEPWHGLRRVLLASQPAMLWPGDVVKVHFLEKDRSLVRQGYPVYGKLAGVVTISEEPRNGKLLLVRTAGRPIIRVEMLEEGATASFAVDNDGIAADDLENGMQVMVVPVERELGKPIRRVRITEICPALDTVQAQENLVKLNNAVPRSFPDAVLAEAEGLPPDPDVSALHGRRDLRNLPFVTIDGDTARDFDDAVCVEREDGGFLLHVAIADVSEYVRPRSAMDREALERGNSWYFPLSVEPMLPKALSNGLCSLNPHVDRLVMWADIHFDGKGLPGRTDFGIGVIRSFARLTYDGTRDMMLRRDEEALSRFRTDNPQAERVIAMLEDALALYHLLRTQRTDRGSLDFDLPETEGMFDEKGHIVGIVRTERHDIHRLIEEFMIAANEAVARRLACGNIDFLYRTHPAPDRDKLVSLRSALQACGILSHSQSRGQIDLRAILAKAQGTPSEYTVNRLCVRSMAQARYSRTNDGHYGLASDAYCHFTSPIRRYADLLVHRALKYVLGLDGGSFPVGEKLDCVADQLNGREREAMECEREMDKRLACLWMHRQSEEKIWHATVSGVMSFGCFVELSEVPVEGLIPVSRLSAGSGDWYEYDDRRQLFVGEMTHIVWQVGSQVKVRCVRSDITTLQIDFQPTGNPERFGRGASPHRNERHHPKKGKGSLREKSQKSSGREKKQSVPVAKSADTDSSS